MKAPKHDGFNERLTTAASSKASLLEKFRARPAADSPAVLERQAAQKAISDAREARNAERWAARAADAAKQAAEEKARMAEERHAPAPLPRRRSKRRPVTRATLLAARAAAERTGTARIGSEPTAGQEASAGGSSTRYDFGVPVILAKVMRSLLSRMSIVKPGMVSSPRPKGSAVSGSAWTLA